MWKKILAASCLLLAGCSSHSLEEYQYEGEALCRVIVKELQKVQSKEELAAALPALKKHFHELVVLIIEAKEFQRNHPDEAGIDPAYFEHPYAEALKEELIRLCKLEGGKEMLEKAQKEALILLSKKR